MPPAPRHGPVSRTLVLLLGLLLGAVAAARPANADHDPAWYVVRAGDNLTRIANRLGTWVADLRTDNDLRTDVIRPGQRLEVSRPFARTAADAILWQRVTRQPRSITARFGPYEENRIIMPRTGVELDLPQGSDVLVPADGVIRYLAVMEELGGVAILEHGAGRHSVLSPFDLASVPWRLGQAVLRGDLLGRTAAPPIAGKQPYLHVELRIDSKAVDPKLLL
jgi:murein DD-endopeptidase MepM/ murein hydrolase activator NlpD